MQNYSFNSDYSCSKNSSVKDPCEIRVQNYSFNSFNSCSKNLVFKPPVSALAANKIRVIRAIRVRIKYRDKSV